ncbi:hypothetical protein SPRG_00981 [Saprolegnia parasitica CBS 223.65]|uniref:Uncharacterized protein n=1 Tax=Saprolegnia parasitica (strain CBS 223.65) TaxID=695850 RepID=A0A067D078_SAPPC|nr:hypothetical protein SPRG_00981 [Saprolegnia parasitica CBS 223.65]KDO34920.1 hypothetical protein SPRG_00981 [Saprolegnia parasitica CBS 223.65]|eukprot:XP_012194578.1 hypothetical protein SPRG_00981 [Saprolegnia parasitica CBS 223.65]
MASSGFGSARLQRHCQGRGLQHAGRRLPRPLRPVLDPRRPPAFLRLLGRLPQSVPQHDTSPRVPNPAKMEAARLGQVEYEAQGRDGVATDGAKGLLGRDRRPVLHLHVKRRSSLYAVFSPSEIYEIHGNIELWQCAGKDEKTGPCSASIWELPPAFRFQINRDTMYAEGFERDPLLSCGTCNGPARPNILMFSDRKWLSNDLDSDRYVDWEAAMEDVLAKHPEKKMVVIEMGCGMRVPSVRHECEMVVRDVLKKEYQRSLTTRQANLIRINPDPSDECIYDWAEVPTAILKIEGTSLAVLETIEAFLQDAE